MNSATDTECPLGDCSGDGKYITRQTDFKGNNLELDLVTMCDNDRRFNGLQSLCIHKACRCKQQNSPIGECKLNDGVMNLNYTHSVQDFIVEWQRPGEILNELRIELELITRKYVQHHDLTDASEMYTLYEWSLTMNFMNTSLTSENKCL